MISVGIMSGTSADGMDLAAVEIEPGTSAPVRVIASDHRSYPPDLRERVLRAASGDGVGAAELARLHVALGNAYADAARAFVATLPRPPEAIALHGQTVSHLPAEHATLQIGDASRVARATGVATIADLRSADIAAGGEGAPLVSFADHVLFASRAPIAMLNVGGIANLTLIPSASADDVVAFDTGPGNMTMDALATRAGERLDRDGRRARAGHAIESVLRSALAHPFFARRPPKSTGREDFGEPFAAGIMAEVSAAGGSLDDALATALAITSRTIADALRRETPPGITWSALVVAGGGARNVALLETLARDVAPLRVMRSDELGVPSDSREAIAFAILGAYRMRGLPNTLPRATGARVAVRGGALHLP